MGLAVMGDGLGLAVGDGEGSAHCSFDVLSDIVASEAKEPSSARTLHASAPVQYQMLARILLQYATRESSASQTLSVNVHVLPLRHNFISSSRPL